MGALLQLLQAGTEQPVAQAVSTSPDLILIGCVVWLLVAALGIGMAFSRAGVE